MDAPKLDEQAQKMVLIACKLMYVNLSHFLLLICFWQHIRRWHINTASYLNDWLSPIPKQHGNRRNWPLYPHSLISLGKDFGLC